MAENGKEVSMIKPQIEAFVESIRPPKEVRDQVDINYSFQKNTLELFEIRPGFQNPEEKTQIPIAKTRYVKTQGVWKIYWMRASGKWESYEPAPEVDVIDDFFKIIKADEYACFFG